MSATRATKPPRLTLEQRLLVEQLRGLGITAQTEVRFHATRRWRIDVAAPEAQLAVEIEGGLWTGGRHVRGVGALGDMAKYNALTEAGWRLLRFTPQQVRDGSAVAQIVRCL